MPSRCEPQSSSARKWVTGNGADSVGACGLSWSPSVDRDIREVSSKVVGCTAVSEPKAAW